MHISRLLCRFNQHQAPLPSDMLVFLPITELLASTASAANIGCQHHNFILLLIGVDGGQVS